MESYENKYATYSDVTTNSGGLGARDEERALNSGLLRLDGTSLLGRNGGSLSGLKLTNEQRDG